MSKKASRGAIHILLHSSCIFYATGAAAHEITSKFLSTPSIHSRIVSTGDTGGGWNKANPLLPLAVVAFL